ncbi:hypothetical protein LTR53_006199 [Teratosphaeriaceae sp. CCFEE 6253]|nr:hypothetical protein LTR53_006199 [Teratosphaeriaceae sp. CCFEE 6253]
MPPGQQSLQERLQDEKAAGVSSTRAREVSMRAGEKRKRAEEESERAEEEGKQAEERSTRLQQENTDYLRNTTIEELIESMRSMTDGEILQLCKALIERVTPVTREPTMEGPLTEQAGRSQGGGGETAHPHGFPAYAHYELTAINRQDFHAQMQSVLSARRTMDAKSVARGLISSIFAGVARVEEVIATSHRVAALVAGGVTQRTAQGKKGNPEMTLASYKRVIEEINAWIQTPDPKDDDDNAGDEE